MNRKAKRPPRRPQSTFLMCDGSYCDSKYTYYYIKVKPPWVSGLHVHSTVSDELVLELVASVNRSPPPGRHGAPGEKGRVDDQKWGVLMDAQGSGLSLRSRGGPCFVVGAFQRNAELVFE